MRTAVSFKNQCTWGVVHTKIDFDDSNGKLTTRIVKHSNNHPTHTCHIHVHPTPLPHSHLKTTHICLMDSLKMTTGISTHAISQVKKQKRYPSNLLSILLTSNISSSSQVLSVSKTSFQRSLDVDVSWSTLNEGKMSFQPFEVHLK